MSEKPKEDSVSEAPSSISETPHFPNARLSSFNTRSEISHAAMGIIVLASEQRVFARIRDFLKSQALESDRFESFESFLS